MPSESISKASTTLSISESGIFEIPNFFRPNFSSVGLIDIFLSSSNLLNISKMDILLLVR